MECLSLRRTQRFYKKNSCEAQMKMKYGIRRKYFTDLAKKTKLKMLKKRNNDGYTKVIGNTNKTRGFYRNSVNLPKQCKNVEFTWLGKLQIQLRLVVFFTKVQSHMQTRIAHCNKKNNDVLFFSFFFFFFMRIDTQDF